MPLQIRKRELPDVGIRYELDFSHDENLATVIHSRTGAAILAIIRKGERIAYSPGDFTLQAGDYTVVTGDQTSHGKLDKILHGTV